MTEVADPFNLIHGMQYGLKAVFVQNFDLAGIIEFRQDQNIPIRCQRSDRDPLLQGCHRKRIHQWRKYRDNPSYAMTVGICLDDGTK